MQLVWEWRKIFQNFKRNDSINYLDKVNLSILSNGQKQTCDAIITQKQIYDALKSMENDFVNDLANTWLMMDYQKSFMKFFGMTSKFH